MQAQINTSGGRIGLARSRASLNDDQNGSQQKKHKNWVHDEVHEANGQQQCKHCNTKVSASNVSYRKRHLLGCEASAGLYILYLYVLQSQQRRCWCHWG